MALTLHSKRLLKTVVSKGITTLSKEIIRRHIDLLALRLLHIDVEVAQLHKDRERVTQLRNDLIAKHFPEEGEAIQQLVTDVLTMEF